MAYPVLLLRIRAMMLDSVVFGVLLLSMVMLSIKLDITDSTTRTIFILAPVTLLEPVMIWLTGGSFGHHYSGIRVVGKNSGENLFVLNGVVRFVAKTFLGLFSLAAMFITKRHQSIHDFLSGSVVVFKDEEEAPSWHKLKARQTEYHAEKPSIIRRLVVILAYWLIALLIYSAFVFFMVSANCIEIGQCSESENPIVSFALLGFLVVLVIVLILGLLCKLPGAYYRVTKSTGSDRRQ